MSQTAAVLTALCDSAALLLLASGPAKLRTPAPTVAALGALRLRAARRLAHERLVRAGGLAEIALACWVLASGGRVAALLLAAAYAGFGAVALRLVHSGTSAACGCFGAASAPVGRTHLAVCLAGTAVALAAAVRPVGSLGTLFAPDPATGAATVVLAVSLTAAGYLCLTALPNLLRG